MRYSFTGDMTPEQITRRRELAKTLLEKNMASSPRNVPEGLNAIARGLIARGTDRMANKAEAKNKDAFATKYGSLFGGGSGGEYTGGTYTPPSKADQMYPVGKTGPAPMPDMEGDLAMGTPVEMDMKTGIEQTAKAVGIDPHVLATVISYETGGTFDPTKAGPTTQWGQHRGLIQFGEPQAQKYGIDWSKPLETQLGPDGAVARYLRDAGVRPGMGLMDVYSAVNAGGVGRYGASDANNGGAPGTVADKVNNQMNGHAQKAAALLGGSYEPAQGDIRTAQAGQFDIGTLADLAGSPYASDGQKAVLGALLQQQMQAMDPQYRLKTQLMQQELADAQNPAASAPNVQSSEILDDGTIVAVMKDGTTQVRDPMGNIVSGQAAANAVEQARMKRAEYERSVYEGRRTGTLDADIAQGGTAEATKALGKEQAGFVTSAFEQADKAAGSIRNIQSAINALDAGGRVGAVDRFLPNITEASADLKNSMDRMGLDVIGSVTFGALSEGEMKLAMETAVPRNLDEAPLREWLSKKLDAQRKVRVALMEQARFLSDPSNTLNDWAEMVGQRAQEGAPPADPATASPAQPGEPSMTTWRGPSPIEIRRMSPQERSAMVSAFRSEEIPDEILDLLIELGEGN